MTIARVLWPLLMVSTGCTAARGTYHMVEAEQEFYLARQIEAGESAVYAWTMAESYMQKAREEFSSSDYEAAEVLAAEAERWSIKAREQAETIEKRLIFDGDPALVPDEIHRIEDVPLITPDEELLLDETTEEDW